MRTISSKYLLAAALMIFSLVTAVADNLTMEPFSIKTGEARTIAVSLNNGKAYSAFQTEFSLPDGLGLSPASADAFSLSARAAANHILKVNFSSPKKIRIICFSTDNATFSGSDGVIFSVTVKAASNFNGGNISLSNIVFSDVSQNDIRFDDIAIPVSRLVLPQSISLSDEEISLKVTEKKKLTATISPTDVTDKTVIWSVDDATVATVDQDGTVTGVSVGDATVTATTSTGISASCRVKVLATQVQSIHFDTWDLSLKIGETATISATVKPESATNKKLQWSSSNSSVASVENGVVTAVAVGKASITAAATDGSGVKAMVEVEVVKPQIERIELNMITAEMQATATLQLTATIFPESASPVELQWKSSNPSVASVSEDGLVKAFARGNTTITCSYILNPEISATCLVTVTKIDVESVTIDESSIELKVDEYKSLSATVLPENATIKTVVWTTDDVSVATVDGTGLVHAVGVGSTIIKAHSSSDWDVVDEYAVTVKDSEIESIDVTPEELSLTVGETAMLEASYLPENATANKITWTSDDETVVTVSATGLVKAIGVGQATIKATHGSVFGSCQVSVAVIPVTDISLDVTEISMSPGDTYRLKATVSPSNATYKDITWESLDESVAIVDKRGLVTCRAVGETYIKASCGEIEARCRINAVSGISEVRAEDKADVVILSITGTRLYCDYENLAPGFYIVNGQKVLKR